MSEHDGRQQNSRKEGTERTRDGSLLLRTTLVVSLKLISLKAVGRLITHPLTTKKWFPPAGLLSQPNRNYQSNIRTRGGSSR
jgi:hypothetical protein